MIAEVVFNLPLDRAFHYDVPPAFEHHLCAGMRVIAPFGSRRLIGVVTRVRATTPIPHPKPLLKLIDAHRVFTTAQLRLATWLADAYCCSLGEACAALVPTALRIPHGVTPEPQGASPLVAAPTLTIQQRRAFLQIEPALMARRHQVFLLHGITGSGKTELYLRTIEAALAHQRAAICLVPEIALTPQMIDRFRQRFGDAVALWHSRLTDRQRAQTWQRLAEGVCRVVVGTRSAVFAPVERVGVIILDEEHDPSYKQDGTPRYHAREVAFVRARLERAIVILGSATPSIESSYHARHGRYVLLELTERVERRPLPQVEVIDMRKEFTDRRRASALSDRLQLALRRTVDLKEQAILFLNRRGFARIAQCPVCGLVIRCTQCTVPLIYHASIQQLACHYCHFRQEVPEICSGCQRGYLRLRGSGTERIESELHRFFPTSSIARMDADTMRLRESHQRLYEALKTQQITLLVGTQLVAKGHDFPQVTLVGVVSADTALNLPDFRAGEQTFDLLTQAAGRAGRGDRPGRVLIQTFCPSHYAIQAASRHDYQGFYQAEIQMRKRLSLPPFVHLVELTVQGYRQERVQAVACSLAQTLRRTLRQRRAISVVGPAPHRVARVRRTFRWRLLLKGRSRSSILRLVRQTLKPSRRFQGLAVIVDVDPL